MLIRTLDGFTSARGRTCLSAPGCWPRLPRSELVATVRSPGLQLQVGREAGSRASPRTMSLQLHSWDSASTYQCNLWLWGPPRCREPITNSVSTVNHPISTLRGRWSWPGSTRQQLRHRRQVCRKTLSPRTHGGHGAGTEWTGSELEGTAGPSSKHMHRIHAHPSCLL